MEIKGEHPLIQEQSSTYDEPHMEELDEVQIDRDNPSHTVLIGSRLEADRKKKEEDHRLPS